MRPRPRWVLLTGILLVTSDDLGQQTHDVSSWQEEFLEEFLIDREAVDLMRRGGFHLAWADDNHYIAYQER